jgi:predicted ArsR family transcriptional regulator
MKPDCTDDLRALLARRRGLENRVLIHLRAFGTATAGELAARLGMRPENIAPRCCDLHTQGLIRPAAVQLPRRAGPGRKPVIWELAEGAE